MDEQLMSWAISRPEVKMTSFIHLLISVEVIKIQKLQGLTMLHEL